MHLRRAVECIEPDLLNDHFISGAIAKMDPQGPAGIRFVAELDRMCRKWRQRGPIGRSAHGDRRRAPDGADDVDPDPERVVLGFRQSARVGVKPPESSCASI